ncbi:MAG: DUF58 domain-containing protein [Myxococcales bacterium]|nr:DUF58 domain-containing protein [Myxococcales bacterium]
MTPSLAKRGKLILASAASFMLLGAITGAAPLVALGGIVIASFWAAYLWFYPAAILLRRRKVEISWWMPTRELAGGALSVDQALPLQLALRNHGARGLRVLRVEVLCSSAIEAPIGMQAFMAAGMQVNIEGVLHARQPGFHVLHGATLHFGDILGLFTLKAYFPNPLPLKVFPRQSHLASASSQLRQGGAAHQRQGLHQVKRRGLAGELRELREHQHGDPFKHIAWKATAKHRKLMVRDLESEVVLTHQFLLDIGGDMREGEVGRRKLDHGIDLVSSLARSALDAGDRVGLVTFDTRVYSQLPPGEGRQQYLKLADRLVEVNGIVDEDLTDLTNSELVAAVSNYLLHQEAMDARIAAAPALDSPMWEYIQAGPKGELYDLKALDRVVSSMLKVFDSARAKASSSTTEKRHVDPFPWKRIPVCTSTSLTGRMRRFARLRGIELPYRCYHEVGKRAAGFAKAVHQVTTGPRADSTVLITDLGGMLDDPKLKLSELTRARRGGRQVIALAPASRPSVLTSSNSKSQQANWMVANVLSREESLRMARATQLLRCNGVPLISVRTDESPASILSKIARVRATTRRGRF